MNFITLHDQGNVAIHFAVANIAAITPCDIWWDNETRAGSRISSIGKFETDVRESPDEVLRLIHEATASSPAGELQEIKRLVEEYFRAVVGNAPPLPIDQWKSREIDGDELRVILTRYRGSMAELGAIIGRHLGGLPEAA